MRILVANRGEIARRIIRTAHRLGHETVAVFAEPDATAPYVAEATIAVPLGSGVALADTYLNSQHVIEAARATSAEAVHPGYGFLAENADFATMCIDAGLIWIGPNPQVIAQMGSKIEARAIADAAEVPTIPGWSESQDPTALAEAAARIGFPVLVKASAGGGGKGIRIANTAVEFAGALSEASAEAERAFGDGQVIVERYIQRPRHVEVQIIADRHGRVAELGTRECSVQRRYQKLLEEAPAPNLPPASRSGLREAAKKLAKAVGYDSAGTVEFVVDDETGDYFFLEMNTRLQVEHPVTEAITGLDLVELMIRVAQGEPLPLDPTQLRFQGHAFEARILAEDPSNNFAPQIGTIHQVSVGHDVRWDSAIEAGSEITPHYDSMIAKLIVHDDNRADALQKLRRALASTIVDGVTTTGGLHYWLTGQQAIIDGRVTTRFLDETEVPAAPEPNLQHAAGAWASTVEAGQASTSPWLGSDFTLTPFEPQLHFGLEDSNGEVHDAVAQSGDPLPANVVDVDASRVAYNEDGWSYGFALKTRTERWAPSAATRQGSGDAIVAPFPAVVAEVGVAPGDVVEGDQVLVVIEAMKMLHSLRATGAATVEDVRVAPGDQIATADILVTFVTETPTESPDPEST